MGYEKVPILFNPIPNHPQNVLEPASPFDYNNAAKNAQDGSATNGGNCHCDTDSTGAEEYEVSLTPSASSVKHCESNGENHNSILEQDPLPIAKSDNDNDSNIKEILEGTSFLVTMYYGSAQNEHYVGPDTVQAMAKQIFESVGPSGKNKEYLFNLAKSMRAICEEAMDPHLKELEAAVKDLETEANLRIPGTPIEL